MHVLFCYYALTKIARRVSLPGFIMRREKKQPGVAVKTHRSSEQNVSRFSVSEQREATDTCPRFQRTELNNDKKEHKSSFHRVRKSWSGSSPSTNTLGL